MLVELMVVILLVGLAALLLKQVPLFGLEAWSSGAKRLRMQEDSYYGLLRIQRSVRTGSFIEEPLVSVPDSSTLTVGDTTFSLNDDFDLTEDDSVLVAGDSGTEFYVERSGNLINVSFTLAREDIRTVVRTSVGPRN